VREGQIKGIAKKREQQNKNSERNIKLKKWKIKK
jgi:hypothetical protein